MWINVSIDIALIFEVVFSIDIRTCWEFNECVNTVPIAYSE